MRLRASFGTLVVLGIKNTRADFQLRTGYFLLGDGCRGGCGFCAQSRDSKRSSRLSRISWPDIDFELLRNHKDYLLKLHRICIQCLDYPGLHVDLIRTITFFRKEMGFPGLLSASINPLPKGQLMVLKEKGLDNVSVPLDLPTEELHEKVKSKYDYQKPTSVLTSGTEESTKCGRSFKGVLKGLEDSLKIFGKGNVTTHLIVGMGENDKEIIGAFDQLDKRGITVGLFAFTPLPHTPMENKEPPSIGRYRGIQLASFLMDVKELPGDVFIFDGNGKLDGLKTEEVPREILTEISPDGRLFHGVCFRTSGCSGCTRPYYNEKPGQVPYNYPRSLSASEIEQGRAALMEYCQW